MRRTTTTPSPGPPSQPPPSPQSSTGFAPAIPTNEPCPIEDRDDGCAQAIAVDRPSGDLPRAVRPRSGDSVPRAGSRRGIFANLRAAEREQHGNNKTPAFRPSDATCDDPHRGFINVV